MELILQDSTIYELNDKDYNYFQNLYKEVDIDQALREMAGWLYSNPSRRKTRRGMKRFINAWLCKANREKPLERSRGARRTRDVSFEEDLFNRDWAL